MSNFTAHLSAFARPATFSFLTIRRAEDAAAYKTEYQTVDENGVVTTETFESMLALQHGKGEFTAVSVEMMLGLTGRAMIAPFAAPKSDNHTYGFAASGLSTTDGRIESAVRRETSRQENAISQLKAQGIEAAPDDAALRKAAEQAATQPGGGGYGLIFETPIELYDGSSCNVFISMKSLVQLLFLAYGNQAPFVHDASLRHVSSALPLKELRANNMNVGGALFFGFPVKVDGTPLMTSKVISGDWASWQQLAETLSVIVATVDASGRTTATSFIRPATIVQMVWDGAVELAKNPVPQVAPQANVMTEKRSVAPGSFTKKLA